MKRHVAAIRPLLPHAIYCIHPFGWLGKQVIKSTNRWVGGILCKGHQHGSFRYFSICLAHRVRRFCARRGARESWMYRVNRPHSLFCVVYSDRIYIVVKDDGTHGARTLVFCSPAEQLFASVPLGTLLYLTLVCHIRSFSL